jgi:hypothetical protein
MYTRASEERVFSPPDKFEMFFQLFFGGRTEKTMPSVNGSNESTCNGDNIGSAKISF